jgi:hypothetical protein
MLSAVKSIRLYDDSHDYRSKHSHDESTSSMVQFRIRTLFFFTLIAACAVVAVFPRILTGDYCRLTVDEVRFEEVGANGYLRIVGDFVVSSGSWVSIQPMSDNIGSTIFADEERAFEPLLRTWPRTQRVSLTVHVDLNRLEIKPNELRAAVGIKPGMAFVARKDQPAEILLVKTRTGKTSEVHLALRLPVKRSG